MIEHIALAVSLVVNAVLWVLYRREQGSREADEMLLEASHEREKLLWVRLAAATDPETR